MFRSTLLPIAALAAIVNANYHGITTTIQDTCAIRQTIQTTITVTVDSNGWPIDSDNAPKVDGRPAGAWGEDNAAWASAAGMGDTHGDGWAAPGKSDAPSSAKYYGAGYGGWVGESAVRSSAALNPGYDMNTWGGDAASTTKTWGYAENDKAKPSGKVWQQGGYADEDHEGQASSRHAYSSKPGVYGGKGHDWEEDPKTTSSSKVSGYDSDANKNGGYGKGGYGKNGHGGDSWSSDAPGKSRANSASSKDWPSASKDAASGIWTKSWSNSSASVWSSMTGTSASWSESSKSVTFSETSKSSGTIFLTSSKSSESSVYSSISTSLGSSSSEASKSSQSPSSFDSSRSSETSKPSESSQFSATSSSASVSSITSVATSLTSSATSSSSSSVSSAVCVPNFNTGCRDSTDCCSGTSGTSCTAGICVPLPPLCLQDNQGACSSNLDCCNRVSGTVCSSGICTPPPNCVADLATGCIANADCCRSGTNGGSICIVGVCTPANTCLTNGQGPCTSVADCCNGATGAICKDTTCQACIPDNSPRQCDVVADCCNSGIAGTTCTNNICTPPPPVCVPNAPLPCSTSADCCGQSQGAVCNTLGFCALPTQCPVIDGSFEAVSPDKFGQQGFSGGWTVQSGMLFASNADTSRPPTPFGNVYIAGLTSTGVNNLNAYQRVELTPNIIYRMEVSYSLNTYQTSGANARCELYATFDLAALLNEVGGNRIDIATLTAVTNGFVTQTYFFTTNGLFQNPQLDIFGTCNSGANGDISYDNIKICPDTGVPCPCVY